MAAEPHVDARTMAPQVSLAAQVSQAIEDQRAMVASVGHCADLAAVIVRHDKLQTQLDKFWTEHADDVAERANAYHSEECPVCLDEIGHGGDLMLTRCGHTYHVGCIIETLADGSVRSCPLCRTDIAQLADHGTCCGKVFTYMCLLRIAFDRVQAQTQRCELPPSPAPSCVHCACLPACAFAPSPATAMRVHAHCRGLACAVHAQVQKNGGDRAGMLHARLQEAEQQSGRQRNAARNKTQTCFTVP